MWHWFCWCFSPVFVNKVSQTKRASLTVTLIKNDCWLKHAVSKSLLTRDNMYCMCKCASCSIIDQKPKTEWEKTSNPNSFSQCPQCSWRVTDIWFQQGSWSLIKLCLSWKLHFIVKFGTGCSYISISKMSSIHHFPIDVYIMHTAL